MGKLKDLAALLFSLALVFVAAGVSAGLGPGAWYASIVKPSWNPPNWLFGPVWTTLYIAMAVAAWLVWRERARASVWLPLGLYGIQLALNALWTPLFFGLHWMGIALAEILLMECFILATMVQFYRLRVISGLLLAPYAAWVAFASFLNFTLWRLNS